MQYFPTYLEIQFLKYIVQNNKKISYEENSDFLEHNKLIIESCIINGFIKKENHKISITEYGNQQI